MCKQYPFIQFKSVILQIEINALYFTYFLQIVENFDMNLIFLMTFISSKNTKMKPF